MFAQYLSILLVNTYSWLGGQGYCSYDFAITETEREYSNVEIVLRPEFDPADTATGNAHLEDQTITLDSIGGARVNWNAKASIETDCNVTGLSIVRATATENGHRVDLLSRGDITVDSYRPLPVRVDGR
jgi:hypothetical protein